MEETFLTEDDAQKMKVDDLKAHLRKRGVSFGGKDKKADLISKLIGSITEKSEPQVESSNTERNNLDSLESGNNHAGPTVDLMAESETRENNKTESSKKASDTSKEVSDEIAVEVESSSEPESKTATISDTESLAQEQQRLRQLIFHQQKKKMEEKYDLTPAAPVDKQVDATETASGAESTNDVPTTAMSQYSTVRIDYLQRPFSVTSLQQWLENLLGIAIEASCIWVTTPTKTHCYVDLPSAIEVENCIQKVSGLKFPAGASNALVVTLTSISAKDAANGHEEAKQAPVDYHKRKTTVMVQPPSTGVQTAPIVTVTLNNASTGSTSTITRGLLSTEAVSSSGRVVVTDAFRKALGTTGSNSPRTAGGATGSNNVENSFGKEQLIMGDFQQGFYTRKYRNILGDPTAQGTTALQGIGIRGVERSQQFQSRGQKRGIGEEEADDLGNDDSILPLKKTVQSSSGIQEPAEKDRGKEDVAISLDELFRKTICKPPLYWLPVSKEILEKRRAEEEASKESYAKKGTKSLSDIRLSSSIDQYHGGAPVHTSSSLAAVSAGGGSRTVAGRDRRYGNYTSNNFPGDRLSRGPVDRSVGIYGPASRNPETGSNRNRSRDRGRPNDGRLDVERSKYEPNGRSDEGPRINDNNRTNASRSMNNRDRGRV